MYTLYFSPDACSLATHTVLNLLGETVEIIHKQDEPNFLELNPMGLVPVLKDGDTVLIEGLPILHYLLTKHRNKLWPHSAAAQQRALQNLAFANASVHPAYGRLFFLANTIEDEAVRTEAFKVAARSIDQCWAAVEKMLEGQLFLGGNTLSAADILLAVYARWGQFFPVDINIGPKAKAMIDNVYATEAFRKALSAEQQYVPMAQAS